RTLPEPEAEAAPRPPTDAAAPAPFVNEPRAELRRPGPRARLVAAVHEAPRAFEAPVLIEGTPVPTTDLLTSVDPGEFATAVCRAGHAGPAEAERAVDAALRALPAWRATPWRERAATLFRAAAILRRRRRHRALELPARHPGGHGHRIPRRRQLRRLQARRAGARGRFPARRDPARGGRPARRAGLPARDGRRGRAPRPSSRRRLRRLH